MRLPHLTAPAIDPSGSFAACLGAVLEQDPSGLPAMDTGGELASLTLVGRSLAGLGLGIARVVAPASFSWPGPWIARLRPPAGVPPRFVLMYGVPSGVVWDPAGDGPVENEWIADGYLVAATDIALARPPLPEAPTAQGVVERIWISPSAGEPAQPREAVRALPGRGLEGDRHVTGTGTFPSGIPGSALTLIDAEVCESFQPPLRPDDHRRNVVTRGLALNQLVGHQFTIGAVRCRGMRLCEPCTVVQRYAGRPVLRELVHRGGLRADILSEGEIRVGDPVRAVQVDVHGTDG
ncbi:MAG TPA: MOSC domain-containing protein [Solirubrobacteraceae bacterium]